MSSFVDSYIGEIKNGTFKGIQKYFQSNEIEMYVRSTKIDLDDAREIIEQLLREVEENGDVRCALAIAAFVRWQYNKLVYIDFDRVYSILKKKIEDGIASGEAEWKEDAMYNNVDIYISTILDINSMQKHDIYRVYDEKLSTDFFEFAKYTRCYEDVMKLFFQNKHIKKTPENIIHMFKALYVDNILKTVNSGRTLTDDEKFDDRYLKKDEVTSIGAFNTLLDNLDKIFVREIRRIKEGKLWSSEDFATFMDLASKDEVLLPLLFSVITTVHDVSNGNDKKINEIITTHKKQFIRWCLLDRSKHGFAETYTEQYKEENEIGKPSYPKYEYDMLEFILDDLLKRDGLDYSAVEVIKGGDYSGVYKVGEYVVKLGSRERKKIPNHRRILQPIIRQECENLFIEVADFIDTNNITEDDYDVVFYDFLKDGLICTDVKTLNFGRLKRKNIPLISTIVLKKDENGKMIPTEELVEQMPDKNATGFTNDIVSEPLGKGEIVLLDTDYVFRLEEFENFDDISLAYLLRLSTAQREALISKYNEIKRQKESNKYVAEIE